MLSTLLCVGNLLGRWWQSLTMRSAAAVSLISCGSSINEVLTPRTAKIGETWWNSETKCNALPWIYDARMPLIWCKWCNSQAWIILNHFSQDSWLHEFSKAKLPCPHSQNLQTETKLRHLHCPLRRNLPKLGESRANFAIEIESSTSPLFLREKNIREPWPKSSCYVVLCRYAYAYIHVHIQRERGRQRATKRKKSVYYTNDYQCISCINIVIS